MTTQPPLHHLLRSGEWTGAEFKAARQGLPKSAFETVSAFANTRGGWIVFGITQDGEQFEVSGVGEPDKLQNDFLSVLHADNKVSHDVDITEYRYAYDGKVVLAFHIAENPRTRKPVYLDGDVRRTFLRKGGGDYRAQPHEIERMLRDQSADRWDGQPFTRVALDEAFHSASLKWYRDRFHAANPGFDVEQPHHEFLYDWGYLVKENRAFLPTHASVALFGSLRGVRNLLPRPILDVQFLGYGSHGEMPETRSIDRLVSEVNIIETWQQLLAKYLFFMPRPFREIDPETLEPGEKDVRNPAIAMAMRRIGMCEQAGTGLRMMLREWQALGYAAPTYENDRVHKAFESFLPQPREVAVDVTPQVTPQVGRLLDAIKGEMSLADLMSGLGLTDRKHFRTQYWLPASEQGLIEMTLPDKPNSSKQRYRLTELGHFTKEALERDQ